MAFVINPGCDATLSLTGLSAGGSPLNAATVTYAFKTAAGVAVAGGTGTMTYTPASSGDYAAAVESTVTSLMAVGAKYRCEVTISSGGYDDFRYVEFYPTYRTLG